MSQSDSLSIIPRTGAWKTHVSFVSIIVLFDTLTNIPQILIPWLADEYPEFSFEEGGGPIGGQKYEFLQLQLYLEILVIP